MDVKAARSVVCVFNSRRLSKPQQVIDLVRYHPSKKLPSKLELYKSILAVIRLHTDRYLRGSGHPGSCAEIVASLDPATQTQLNAIDPAILRAFMFLRAATDFESLPMDDYFTISVRIFIPPSVHAVAHDTRYSFSLRSRHLENRGALDSAGHLAIPSSVRALPLFKLSSMRILFATSCQTRLAMRSTYGYTRQCWPRSAHTHAPDRHLYIP
jgi:hypothetical protein